jgi:citrate lyase beta subunit
MSFLDNLKNNLKALERLEEKDPEKVKRDQERREADRNSALLRGPHVEALKKSAFTSELLTQCRTIGHSQRVLVQFTWIGESLRLDAKAKRMELIPTAEGITAVFSMNGMETGRARVHPQADDAAALAQRWLTGRD